MTVNGTITGLDFGNFQLVTISGQVFNDLTGSGSLAPGDPGLQGWEGDLLDVSGNYRFTAVPPGTLSVAEVVQTNWVQTQPQYPTAYTITGTSGHTVVGLKFGDHYAPPLNPVAMIDNGQPGYAETGTWTTALGGFNGTTRVATTIQGRQPTATASWTFSGLPVHNYQVWVTFAGKNSYSTAAPFTVYNGSTSEGTTLLNESILVTQSKGGLAQGS